MHITDPPERQRCRIDYQLGPPVSACAGNRVRRLPGRVCAPRISKVLSYNQGRKAAIEGGLEIMPSLLAANPRSMASLPLTIRPRSAPIWRQKQAQRHEFFIVGVDGSPGRVKGRCRET